MAVHAMPTVSLVEFHLLIVFTQRWFHMDFVTTLNVTFHEVKCF